MFHQWGRFIYWLGQGQNAAAVQGIAAIVSTVLTLILIMVTLRYVALTNTLASTANAQFEAMFQPSVRLNAAIGSSSGRVEIMIQNETLLPIYLETVTLTFNFSDETWLPAQKLGQLAQVVIPAASKLERAYELGEEVLTSKWNLVTGIHFYIQCTDLTGATHHAFVWLSDEGVTKYFHPMEIAKKEAEFQKRAPWRYRLYKVKSLLSKR